MTLPELPANASKLELRKALIQMRLELHRQQLRHETLLVVKPLQDAHKISQQWRAVLGNNHAPIWGAAALAIAALVFVRRNQLSSWLRMGSALAPLLTQLLRRPTAAPAAESASPASDT